MMKKSVLILTIILFLVSIPFLISESSPNSFTINKVLLKSVIKQDETLNTSIKITNLKDEKSFEIEIIGLGNLISLSEKDFILNAQESKEIGVFFDSDNSAPGVYVGSLIIKSNSEEKVIPIILEVQSLNQYFVINLDIDPEYKEVQRGKEIVPGIKFFNLKDTDTHSVEIDYKIINLKGEEILSERETLAIGSKSSVIKNILLSKEIETGKYVFAVILNFKNATSTSSYLFSVTSKRITLPSSNINSFSLIISIFLLLIILIIVYILYERKQLFSQLKNQQKSEIKYYSKKIDTKEKESIDNAKTEKEKGKIIKEFEDAKNKIIRGMKKVQIGQRKELKKLNKQKNKEGIEKRLVKWKKEVYPKALKSAEIDHKLKIKLGVLREAYEEGYISEESYKKGKSRIESTNKK